MSRHGVVSDMEKRNPREAFDNIRMWTHSLQHPETEWREAEGDYLAFSNKHRRMQAA